MSGINKPNEISKKVEDKISKKYLYSYNNEETRQRIVEDIKSILEEEIYGSIEYDLIIKLHGIETASIKVETLIQDLTDWINIQKYGTPEKIGRKNKAYLVWVKGHGEMIMYWDGEYWNDEFNDDISQYSSKVTHWKNLPGSPKN